MALFRSRKQLGATLSVSLSALLILLKVVVGVMTGSVAVLASAVDSIIDLVASFLAYFAIFLAEAPPDNEHPFGHGKFEDFAGLIQAVMIMLGAIFIIHEALPKLMHPATYAVEPTPGILVMGFSLVAAFVVSQILFRISRETESSALHADAHHLNTDAMTSVAVLVGLVLVKVTHNPIFDPAVALMVAGLILWVGFRIVKTVFNHLMDTALPSAEEDRIRTIIYDTMPPEEPVMVEALKTRRSGSHRLIVFNLKVAPDLTVQQAHDYCDQIESALEETFPNSLVNIHLEPLERKN